MTFSTLLRMLRLLTLSALASTVLITGCGGEDDGVASSTETVGVVATTTQVADLARNVGGKRVEVTGLLAANADPHDHEVRPRDIEALADSELVLRSGGDLDEWLTEAIEGSGAEAPVLTLIDQVETIEGGESEHGEDAHTEEEADHAGEEEAAEAGAGEPHAEEAVDPHWWQDPRNAERAVRAMRDALVAADPEGRETYTDNASAYARDLRELDAAVATCMDRVPEAQRKLVSTHDSLGYYADRYGIEVVGTVIPSLSTQGQPSAGEIRDLVETIEREDVKAIFTESSVNPRVERAIAEESGATIGAPLWADTLGPEGSAGGTYLESIAGNTLALVDGFSGGMVTCRLPS